MSSLSHWIVAPSWGYAQRHALNRSSTPARRGALMPEVIFEINRDLTVPMAQQAVPGHNRWHPDIPPANTVGPGATYRIECKDWTDNQVRNSDDAEDIRDMNLDPCHVLSGPFAIEGAEPGDLLVVDIVNMGPFNEQPWGYTGIFAKENGGGVPRGLRQGEGRGLPHGPIPGSVQGDLGPRRHLDQFTARPRSPVHRQLSPGPVRLCALSRPVGRVEPARAGADRPQPRPGHR